MDDYRLHHVTQTQKGDILSAIARVLGSDGKIAFAFLHGSLTEREDIHDIDVGIYLKSATAEAATATWRLEVELAEPLEAEARGITGVAVPVDVRVMNHAPLAAQFAVLTGELVYLADVELFTAIVEEIVPRYLDLQPLRERALRDMLSA